MHFNFILKRIRTAVPKLTKPSQNPTRISRPAPASHLCFYAMSEPASIPASEAESSFASLLASLTGPAKKPSQTWDDSALADDVAIISYEQALRSQRRVPPPAVLPENETQSTAPAPHSPPVGAGKTRKTSSITIRLTEAEQAQLQQRAAAAELSVSAYLRSCIFEAESLRAQVKEALSQMKAGSSTDPHCGDETDSKLATNWRTRLFPHWSRHRASA